MGVGGGVGVGGCGWGLHRAKKTFKGTVEYHWKKNTRLK